MQLIDHHAHFFTATILNWKHLLKEDKYKDVIIESLRFLVKENRIKVYAFNIMPNHIHVIWHIQAGYKREDVQRDFLKFTAQQFKSVLVESNSALLKEFEVNAADRTYQFWKRNSLSIELFTESVFIQKLEYIHCNPIQPRWLLCKYPEEYKYSSARFYKTGVDDWGFLTHFRD